MRQRRNSSLESLRLDVLLVILLGLNISIVEEKPQDLKGETISESRKPKKNWNISMCFINEPRTGHVISTELELLWV
jgi:hypothetical protein